MGDWPGSKCSHRNIGEDYAGILQCDGWSAYEAYEAYEGDHPEINFMSCLAHIRRRFYDYSLLSKAQKVKSKAVRQCGFILNPDQPPSGQINFNSRLSN
ncbi:MAG: hypothetical protein ACI9NQ_001604 [Paracoccaceae bacterium]